MNHLLLGIDEKQTFDEFVESLDFSKGYVTFQKSYSYVGKNNLWAEYGYYNFIRHKSELIERGYHLIEINESDNLFRDDMVTYIYKPEDIGSFRLKKFEQYIPMLTLVGIVLFIILFFILISLDIKL